MSLDARAQLVLQRLRNGPAGTVELQRSPIVHVAKNILDLRRAGYLITTTRTSNGTALYKLIGKLPDAPVEGGSPLRVSTPPSSRAPRTVPQFGDVAAIREMRR